MSFPNSAAARLFPLVPRRVARRLSSRYIAGLTVDEAVPVAQRLRGHGILATLDILGEAVHSVEEAAAYTAQYVDAVEALDEAGLQPHVSVKPSALGSLLDWRLCEQLVCAIAQTAEERRGTVCIDMEWSHAIDGTLDLYRTLRAHGFDNVAMVTQARLHRTRSDLVALGELKPHVRICKGVYPESMQIAYTDSEAIRRNYAFCLDALLDSGGFAAIATHDEALIVAALERLARHRRAQGTYEFQMLLGVREDLARSLAAAGHQVRVYVPYGKDWHQYAIRRFRESPQIIGYVARELLRQVGERFSKRPVPVNGVGR